MMKTPRENLIKRLQKKLEQQGDKVLFRDSHRTMTSREVLDQALIMVQLLEKTFSPRAKIGLLLPNSAAWGVALLGTWFSGRVAVPMHFYEDSEAAMTPLKWVDGVIALKNSNHRLPPNSVPTLFLNEDGVLSESSSGTGQIIPLRTATRPETTLILMTSGSTGERKGVELSEKNLDFIIDLVAQRLRFNSDVRAHIVLPLSHIMALNTQLLPTVFNGGTCVFEHPPQVAPQIFSAIQRERCSFLTLIPDLIRAAYLEWKSGQGPTASFVHEVQISGGMIHPEHVQQARTVFPNARLHRAYGMTEAVRIATIDSDHPGFNSTCAGLVSPGVEVEIRDGVVHVRGPNVALGYNTGEIFPRTSDGFFNTGDRGHLDEEGQLFIEGRADRTLKIQGAKVSLDQIEKVTQSHPAIAFAVATEKQGQIKLFVEPKNPNQFFTVQADFENHLIKNLDPNHCPRTVIVMSRFPRVTSGKIDYRSLLSIPLSPSTFETEGATLRGIQFWRQTSEPT